MTSYNTYYYIVAIESYSCQPLDVPTHNTNTSLPLNMTITTNNIYFILL